MKPQLTLFQRSTYDAVFHHPTAHNLGWRNIRSILGALGEVVEEHNGNLKVTRNGQTLVLHPPLDKTVTEVGELMEICRFLERSDIIPQAAVAEGMYLLVVIDHLDIRVYQTEAHGPVPQPALPYDPDGFGRHLHYVQDDSNGQGESEHKSFYETVAQTLRGADKILIFGNGTDARRAMGQFLTELKHHHSDVAKCIVGSVVLEEHHLTEEQLLAKARDFYAKIAS